MRVVRGKRDTIIVSEEGDECYLSFGFKTLLIDFPLRLHTKYSPEEVANLIRREGRRYYFPFRLAVDILITEIRRTSVSKLKYVLLEGNEITIIRLGKKLAQFAVGEADRLYIIELDEVFIPKRLFRWTVFEFSKNKVLPVIRKERRGYLLKDGVGFVPVSWVRRRGDGKVVVGIKINDVVTPTMLLKVHSLKASNR